MSKNKNLTFFIICTSVIPYIAFLLWLQAKKGHADWSYLPMLNLLILLNIPASASAESKERWRPFYKKTYAVTCRVLQLFVFLAGALCIYHGIAFPMWTAIIPVALVPFVYLLIFK